VSRPQGRENPVPIKGAGWKTAGKTTTYPQMWKSG
jgi:hypothetical protein